jgi:hypothetical protein
MNEPESDMDRYRNALRPTRKVVGKMLLWNICFVLGLIALVYAIVGSGNLRGILLLIPYILAGAGVLFWALFKNKAGKQ